MVEYQISDPEVIDALGELIEKVMVSTQEEGSKTKKKEENGTANENSQVDEEVKKVVEELIESVENEENGAPECPHLKGILKPSRCRCGSNHHVDFTMKPDLIRSFDEETDYTIDIQFVEKHPVKIVSYRKLLAEKKQEANSQEETDR